MASKSGELKAPIALLRVEALNPQVPQDVAREIPLYDGESLRIGRSKSNALVLPDSKVSRFHAIISGSSAGVVISDLASTNGTMLNNKRLSAPVDLANGDSIHIGGYSISVALKATHDDQPSDSARTVLSQMLPFEISVMLVDVCGYTTMAQVLPEEDVAEMLRAWLNFSAAIVSKHQGSVDKFIGDCVMSLWRSETSEPKELAIHAAQAAIEIVESTNNDKQFREWKHAATHPWRCRSVIHSGTALLGSLGGENRANYTVLGDTVNVAFRIEHLADKFSEKLIVSEQTASLLTPEISLRSLGKFALEGRSGLIEIFGRELLG